MNLQEQLAKALRNASNDDPAQEVRRFSREATKPVTFRLLNDGKNPQGLIVQACPSGDPGIYQELSVSFHAPDGKRVADILIGLDLETLEARVLVTADGDGDGDKKIAIYPERAMSEGAVRNYN
jgi:hypothetical protein